MEAKKAASNTRESTEPWILGDPAGMKMRINECLRFLELFHGTLTGRGESVEMQIWVLIVCTKGLVGH